MRVDGRKTFVLLLVALFGFVSLSSLPRVVPSAKNNSPSQQPAESGNETKGSEKSFEFNSELEFALVSVLPWDDRSAAVPTALLAQSAALILGDGVLDRPDLSRAPPA